MDPLNTVVSTPPFGQPPPIDRTWDEAFLRVESYLRSHRLESRIQISRLTTDIIGAAQTEAAGRPGLLPVQLAMEIADRRMSAWFMRVLGEAELDEPRLGARGRLALVLADVPGRWPQYFLSDETPPADMVAAMRSAYVEAGPQLRFSNMVPRPIDLGPIASAAGETWSTLRRWPLLRAGLGWLLIVGALAGIWAATH
ncbi:MAG: hypothetical protein ABII82_17085 [Verrucomicrobiota bacterium]